MSVSGTPVVWRDYPATAQRMREIISQASYDPLVREAAIELIDPARSGAYVDEARLLFQFFVENIKYIGDPYNGDVLQWPQLTLRNRAADCNNRVIALGALAKSIGFPVRMVFAWDKPTPDLVRDYPIHVWLQLDVTKAEGNRPAWIPLETTPTRDPVAMETNLYLDFGQEFPMPGWREYVAVD